VNLAYQALADAGLTTAHVGRGTFVASRGRPRLAEAPAASARFPWEGVLARRALNVPRLLARAAARGAIEFDFRGGQVDPELLPARELRRACGRAIDQALPRLARPLDPRGWLPLRQEIARGLVARGIRSEPAEVLVTSGAQQALDLVARVLLEPGDTVVMEQPGYFGAAMAFEAAGAHIVPVTVDAEGLRTEELARILRSRRAKLVYATPAVQSPTGVMLSEARRRSLLDLTDEHQTPVLEDDYDSELRVGPAPPALKTADETGHVIYAGTFAKALLPGLRVGYLVAAPELLDRLALVRSAVDVATDGLAQAVVAELLRAGALERHVRRVRRHYARRLDGMLEALARAMPEGTSAVRPAGGTAVWVTLPSGADSDAVLGAALEAGVAYTPGELFFVDGRGAGQLSLSFARVPESRIAEGVERLGAAVSRTLGIGRRRAGGSHA
jgi:GntR family transcriptional regulator/MocR family aminotransferase